MVISIRTEELRGGWLARVECASCIGGAEGKSRILAIESAAVMALEAIAADMKDGTVSLSHVFPVSLTIDEGAA